MKTKRKVYILMGKFTDSNGFVNSSICDVSHNKEKINETMKRNQKRSFVTAYYIKEYYAND